MDAQPSPRRNRFLAASCLAITTLLAGVALRAADEPAGGEKKPSSAIEIATVTRAEPVDFGKDILPIFRQNCIACHNAKDQEGDLVLETPQGIRKGGESGAAIVEGKGMESLLLRSAAKLDKPFMPPKSNKVGASPLTPQQLGLLKLWIDQGAKGEGAGAAGPVQWHPLPAGLNPIYAVAVTDDGQLAAANRANQIFVYSLPKRQLLTRLTDPSLLATVGKGHPGVAHRDLVQSLAFSPDGKLLASGGYREVKLWQRPDPAVRFTVPAVATKRVGAVATSPDGKTVAVGSDDGVVRLFNAADGKPGLELKGHAGEVTTLRFSDEGEWLLSGSADKSVRVWKVADGTAAMHLQTPHPVSAALALAPAADGPPQIVTAGGDNQLRLWSMPAAPNAVEGDIPGPVTATAATFARPRAVTRHRRGPRRTRPRTARSWRPCHGGRQFLTGRATCRESVRTERPTRGSRPRGVACATRTRRPARACPPRCYSRSARWPASPAAPGSRPPSTRTSATTSSRWTATAGR